MLVSLKQKMELNRYNNMKFDFFKIWNRPWKSCYKLGFWMAGFQSRWKNSSSRAAVAHRFRSGWWRICVGGRGQILPLHGRRDGKERVYQNRLADDETCHHEGARKVQTDGRCGDWETQWNSRATRRSPPRGNTLKFCFSFSKKILILNFQTSPEKEDDEEEEEEGGEDSDVVRPSPVASTQVEYDDETKALIEGNH